MCPILMPPLEHARVAHRRHRCRCLRSFHRATAAARLIGQRRLLSRWPVCDTRTGSRPLQHLHESGFVRWREERFDPVPVKSDVRRIRLTLYAGSLAQRRLAPRVPPTHINGALVPSATSVRHCTSMSSLYPALVSNGCWCVDALAHDAIGAAARRTLMSHSSAEPRSSRTLTVAHGVVTHATQRETVFARRNCEGVLTKVQMLFSQFGEPLCYFFRFQFATTCETEEFDESWCVRSTSKCSARSHAADRWDVRHGVRTDARLPDGNRQRR